MEKHEDCWALGLMSGTSLDGIDAALIRTDGRAVLETGAFRTFPYDSDFRERLRGQLGCRDRESAAALAVERELTLLHAQAVKALLREAPGKVAVIGFHGHTLLHEPDEGQTWQIGDGALLAAESGIDVVCDFRSRDVAAGGQGAPFVPLYHAALAGALPRPLAVLNIGGVANVTWIGSETGSGSEAELLAFDTGPGNALLDDWVLRREGLAFDAGGALASSGRADQAVLAALLSHPFFDRAPPKSLDRDAFESAPLAALTTADGAATLAAFTAAAVARAAAHFPAPVRSWLVTGGGRHNAAIMAELRALLEVPVEAVEAVGWQGDALEAQAFAYLARRSLEGLPLNLPSTTGVPRPTGGGRLFRAEKSG